MPMIHLLNSWWDHVWSWKLIRIQLNLNCHVEMNYVCVFFLDKKRLHLVIVWCLQPCALKKRWSLFFFNAARAISLELSITNLQFSQAAEPWKWPNDFVWTNPIPSMGLVYFPYIYHTNQLNVGEYTSPMDGMGTMGWWVFQKQTTDFGQLLMGFVEL